MRFPAPAIRLPGAVSLAVRQTGFLVRAAVRPSPDCQTGRETVGRVAKVLSALRNQPEPDSQNSDVTGLAVQGSGLG